METSSYVAACWGAILAGGLGVASATTAWAQDQVRFGDAVSLQGHHNDFLASEDVTEGYALHADRLEVGAWERFTVLDADGQPGGSVRFGDTVTLRSDHGRWICAEPNGPAVADRTAVGGWERFVILSPDGVTGPVRSFSSVALVSAHSTYLTTANDRSVSASATALGSSERWRIRVEGAGATLGFGDAIALRGYHDGYVVAEGPAEGYDLRANRPQVGGFETFGLLDAAGGGSGPVRFGDVVTLRSFHSTYVCAESGGGAVADRGAIGAWEQFVLQSPDGFEGPVRALDAVAFRTSHGTYLTTRPDFTAHSDATGLYAHERFTISLEQRDATPVTLYAVSSYGHLGWFQHLGAESGAAEWAAASGAVIGSGWEGFARVLGASDGAIWALETNGGLRWYAHADPSEGAADFSPGSGALVGSGWGGLTLVPAPDGVIYARDTQGVLHYYRDLDFDAGGGHWAHNGVGQPQGAGWDAYAHIFAGSEGAVYGVTPGGDVYWFKHLGRLDGAADWTGGLLVASGWPSYAQVVGGPRGTVYAIDASGNLTWLRHEGYADGAATWQGPALVGTGWPAQRSVFASFPPSWADGSTPVPESPIVVPNPPGPPPEYVAATYHGAWPCREGFLDAWTASCWSCPRGFDRTIFAIDGNMACEKVVEEQLYAASRKDRPTAPCWTELGFSVCSPVATDCPSGQFYDPWDGGWCWSCPGGTNRTANPVYNHDACVRPAYTEYASATGHGPSGCRAGEFHDAINGGECWSCPVAYDRTIHPVTASNACQMHEGEGLCAAIFGQLGDTLPDDLAAGTLPAHCALSFVEGAVCLLPESAGALAEAITNISNPTCQQQPPLVDKVCDVTLGEAARFAAFAQCVDGILEGAAQLGTVTFQPANFPEDACRMLGETAAATVIESKLKVTLQNRSERFRRLFERMEASRVLQAADGTSGAITQLRELAEACVQNR